VPAFKAAGVEHRRIYAMRHTFATWSLAAGMSDAEDQDRDLLWARKRLEPTRQPRHKMRKAQRLQGFLRGAPERIRTSDLRFRRRR